MFKPALVEHSISPPLDWDDMPFGLALKSLYEQQLQDIAQQCFGYHLIKLGSLSSQMALDSCQIKHQINHAAKLGNNSDVVSLDTELPYAEKSVDAILMAHVLDFSNDPHKILREVDHCLIPNGQLIIIGFNPYSIAGLARWLPVDRSNVIHQARFFRRSRIRDWLALLGYEVTTEQRFLFSEMLFRKELPKNRKWNAIAQKYLSFFSSIYVIVGKKREYPLSLVKPVWKPVPKFSPVGASIRLKGRNLENL